MAWTDVANAELGRQAPYVIEQLNSVNPNFDWSSAIREAAADLTRTYADKGWEDPSRGSPMGVARQITGKVPVGAAHFAANTGVQNQQDASILAAQNPPDDDGFMGLGDLGTLAMLAAAVYSGGSALGAWGAGAGASGAGALGAAGLEAGALTGSLGYGAALEGSLAGLGAAGAAGASGMDPSWFSDWGSNTGLGNLDAGAFNGVSEAGGIDWSNIDSMIENLGSAAGEAENLGTAASVQERMTLLQQLKQLTDQLPTGTRQAVEQGLKAAAGGNSSAMGLLKNLGIPAALVAGLFEKNTNPLTGQVTNAANGALSSAGAFAGMSPVGMQPSWQKAITTANENTGAWKPYVDKASAYTNEAAGGLPSVNLSQYMNPYLDSVLTPALREINLASDQERMRLNHLAKVSGNDTMTPGSSTPSGYGVQLDLLNKNKMQRIGDTTANLYKGAFDTATGLATGDLNRKMTAGGAFNTLANTVGTQGRGDVTTLAGAGDLEAKPQENALTHAADSSKLYSSVIPGTSSAITATNKPSTLGQAVGAFGAYNAANKAGWFD